MFLNALVVAAILFWVSSAWGAPKYKVLHAFGKGKDGGGLYGGLVFDRQGNLYGGTSGGGDYGYGTVFQLSPGKNGAWGERVLRSFRNNDPDGDEINGSLTVDAVDRIYGATTFGGGPYTHGTVFQMTQKADGWAYTVIHRFGRTDKADDPFAGLIMDGAGNLYGAGGCAFDLSPESDGRWKEHILHCFPGYQGDGSGPYAVILDAKGNLYGETNMGGTSKLCGGGCGTVYQLQRTSGGWKEHILHDFGTGNDDMGFPGGPLLRDKTGHLYGTAGGGVHAHGAVYRLTRLPDGRWQAAIQHSFTGGAGGDGPSGGVAMDKSGNLYGTTVAGGDPNCDCGVVYKLTSQANGKWKYTVLHRFTGNDVAQPIAQLVLDGKGNLYGTTITGGAGGYGVAFEITP
jgi:uncharacterized repeat protein (TIGR03803 family)